VLSDHGRALAIAIRCCDHWRVMAEYAHDVETAFRLNGADVRARVSPRVTLLDWLREDAGLTGAKKGCNEGACGACTVLVDGRPMNGCLTLVVQCAGLEVTTVAGPGRAERRAASGAARVHR
jgi:aerobic-type carbon monoxide dehydrogenase small subunit (CoxS/CutS family)